MILNIDETRATAAAQYASELNKIKEHNCKACAVEYEKLLHDFRKMIKHPDDEVLINLVDDKISGLLALCVESEDKYLEAVGGVFARDNYQEIAMHFYEYIKEKYAGFRFDAVYPEENKEAIYFMNSIGANCKGLAMEMNLEKANFKYPICSKQVVQLSNKYYKSFSRFHDKNSPNVYWTGERILASLDKFDVFIILNNDEVVGTVVTSAFGGRKREIYFIEIETYPQREECINSLLQSSIDKSFSSGADEIMIILEENNIDEIKLYESLGFQKVDVCRTYSIESL